MKGNHLRPLLPLLACLALAGCGIFGPDEADCVAGEFPAMCATIRGVVTDSAGMPLKDIVVGPRYIVDEWVSTVYSTTDERGHYSFTIERTLGIDPSGVDPDTLTLFVGASRVNEGWLDSVQAFVRFGRPAVINEVDLSIRE